MPNTSTKTDILSTVARVADAAHLVATQFPTLPADEQTALAVAIVNGKIAYCESCGHVYETAGRCGVCDDLADAEAAAQDADAYNRNASYYSRF